MRWPAAFVSRLALTAAVISLLAGPSAATLWISSPDGSDVQQRVRAVLGGYGVALLSPDEVPPMLANAVVATEDERFYSHHGVDSIGLGRALLYDVTNAC